MTRGGSAPATLRPGRDADAPGIIALIRDCWAEYPGCVFDLDGEVPELRALAAWFALRGGALWVAEREPGRVLGMIGTRPAAGAAWEICRLYVAAEARGSAAGGVAHRLLDAAEAHARAAGAARLVLWSDSRFERAHHFYGKRGYVRSGPVRVLDDLSRSLEFGFAKPARGLVVEPLDVAAAASTEARLAEILLACVATGDRVGFFPPLAPDRACRVWRRVATEVATGTRLLLAAWQDGMLIGTVQIDLAMPETHPHCAVGVMLLVDPAARRRGAGAALLRQAELAARGAGRRLLTLELRAGDGAGPLCRALGWQESGHIPCHVLNADRRTASDTVLLHKALPP